MYSSPKFSNIFIAILALSALALAFFVFSGNSTVEPKTLLDQIGKSEQNKNTEPKVFAATQEPVNTRGILLFSGANSFKDIYSQLPLRAKSIGEEYYIRTQIAALCVPYTTGHQPDNSLNSQALSKFKNTFCSGFDGNLSSEQSNLASLPSDDAFRSVYSTSASLFSSIGEDGLPHEKSKSAIFDLSASMLKKNGGLEALVAAEAFMNAGVVSDQFTKLIPEASAGLTHNELVEAQLAFVQLRMCDSYGGCGPNQLLTMHYCSRTSSCEPGASADKNLQQHLPTKVLLTATRLKNKFDY